MKYEASLAIELCRRVESMNLGFKSKAQSIRAVHSHEKDEQLKLTLNVTLNFRWNLDANVYFEVFEYVKAVPLSRYSTGLRALFRDDQMVMQITMITLPSLPPLLSFFFLSLWP